jgi:hypothetical protein
LRLIFAKKADYHPGMPRSTPTRSDGGRRRALLRGLARLAALAAVLLVPIAMLAGWLDKVAGPAETGTSRAAPAGALERAARHLRSLPAVPGRVALAGEATGEGHWRFVNRAGEPFTAGTPDEMKRAVAVLYPAAKASPRLAIHVTPDTIFHHRTALAALPAGAELFVVAGAHSYRLRRRADGALERYFAEVRPNLVIEMTDRRAFEEAAWQLERPLDQARVRVLALEPGGPVTLPPRPRIDPASRRAVVDVIDPASLAAAMGAVRGQTLLIAARIEGGRLYVQPASGPERSLPLKDLFGAAAAADVNLLVMQAASTPRQPGGRNWLWQKVEVSGLDEALRRARMADFLDGLGASHRRLAAAALPLGDRTAFELAAAGELPGAPPASPVSDLFSRIVADLTGRVVATSVQASLRSAARQRELDRRVVPGVPSGVQAGYLVLLAIGLLGMPAARAWWQAIWPAEVAQDYAGRAGYWAACVTRGLAFAAVFLPLAAPFAAFSNLAGQVRDAVTAPVRWWRSLGRRRPAAAAPPDSAVAAAPALAHNAAPPPALPGDREGGWPALPRFLSRPAGRSKRAVHGNARG